MTAQWLLRSPRTLHLRDGGFTRPFSFALVAGSALPGHLSGGLDGDAWRWTNEQGGTVGFVRLSDVGEAGSALYFL